MVPAMSLRLDDLQLSPARLADVRDALAARIREGLAHDGREVRALPAFLPPAPVELAGEALVVDMGGTNLRAAVVALSAHAPARVVAGPVSARVPLRGEGGVYLDAEGLYALQADLVGQLDPPPDLPLGYCFSYPSEVLPTRDARLIRWTKGLDIPGVEGTLVGAGLAATLARRGLRPARVAVLNDTVASLLAGARGTPGRARDVVALIAGTGTNMASFYDHGQAPKLAGHPGVMAVNYESGNFTPPHLTPWDDAVDAASNNVGLQRFEKAVSGYYLPYIFKAALPDHDLDPSLGTEPLVALQDRADGSPASALAHALLTRSADLVAAGLAGALRTFPADAGVAGIVAEGSLFWRATGYADRVQATLRFLLDPGQAFEILRVEEANLVGAACAALVG
jgi:hexokinase